VVVGERRHGLRRAVRFVEVQRGHGGEAASAEVELRRLVELVGHAVGVHRVDNDGVGGLGEGATARASSARSAPCTSGGRMSRAAARTTMAVATSEPRDPQFSAAFMSSAGKIRRSVLLSEVIEEMDYDVCLVNECDSHMVWISHAISRVI
jgi:hypothetical protein